MGDIFAWFVENAVPGVPRARGATRGIDLHQLLDREGRAHAPGEHGLLALDWCNGNRTVLVDADLTGLLLGTTLATRARGDLPRADRGHRLRHAR